MLSERTITTDDADELESHLRNEDDVLLDQGLDPEDAFREAVRRMGDYAMLETVYRRVYWKKLRAERHVTKELTRRLVKLINPPTLRDIKLSRFEGIVNSLPVSGGDYLLHRDVSISLAHSPDCHDPVGYRSPRRTLDTGIAAD